MVTSVTSKKKYTLDEVKDPEIKKALIQKMYKLNNGQVSAFFLMEHLPYGKQMFVLKGYAGTGKTYCINAFIKYQILKNKHVSIAVTAPTNKAVKVLAQKKDKNAGNVYYRTVHSLFGLTEQIDSQGNITYTPGKKTNYSASDYQYIIVDECSMLPDDLFYLLDGIKTQVKIIFMGDPCQIPPVKEKNSIPFKRGLSTYCEEGYTLNEIMRQKDENPIIPLTLKVRENLNKETPIPAFSTQLNSKNEGIVLVDTFEELLSKFKEYFVCQKFISDADYAKVIAWTNAKVHAANREIRKILYGENLPKIVVGEKLLANSPIMGSKVKSNGKKELYHTVVFNTSDEMYVESYTIDKVNVNMFGLKAHTLKVYSCRVGYEDSDGNLMFDTIRILHEDSHEEFNKHLESLRQMALSRKPGANWLSYYDYKRKFADVTYNYAITAHKSQGSTYENVFVIEDDLNANPKVEERNRIKYTAYSRASKKLFIYKKKQQ